jgi:hypothetical protein
MGLIMLTLSKKLLRTLKMDPPFFCSGTDAWLKRSPWIVETVLETAIEQLLGVAWQDAKLRSPFTRLMLDTASMDKVPPANALLFVQRLVILVGDPCVKGMISYHEHPIQNDA